jgi:ribosomal protein L11 methyltransferase
MKWTLITIETKPSNIDEICAVLSAYGIDGVEIIDPLENKRFLDEGKIYNWDYVDESLENSMKSDSAEIIFYLPLGDGDAGGSAEADVLSVALPRGAPLRAADIVCALSGALGDLGHIKSYVVDDNWTDAWREHYKPFKIGSRIVIRPFWEEYTPLDNLDNEVIFTIDPGHVFGTGQHQSTALCISLLDGHLKPGDGLLDIGCGSGILAIIALLLGAAHATAIDIDPSAVEMTLKNASLNNIGQDKITAYCGNILSGDLNVSAAKPYDIAVANIVADVIIKLAPVVFGMLTNGGKFIAGGIIDDRKDEVSKALISAGFKIEETLTQDGWVAFLCIVSL